MIIIILSGRVVWDVRISGNNYLDEQEIIMALADQGLTVGSRVKKVDADVIENKVLIESDEISWIAINLTGNVAFVEIRERLPSYLIESTSPANLVASCDGQIESVESYEGEVKVTPGQFVRKGDLLISGIYDSYPWGYRYTRARGNVMARTIRTISIEIPLIYQKKVYTGVSNTKNSLFFFSNEIKLYRSTGFLGITYDTIYNVDKYCLPNGIRLPIERHRITHMEYTYKTCERTSQEAMDLAYRELDVQVDNLISGGTTILRKNITGELHETSYLLECTLTIIENIAETIEFEVSE